MRYIIYSIFCGVLYVFIACATTGGDGSSNTYVITFEEIESVNATTAFEIMQRLRPGLLNRDNQRIGRLDVGASTSFRQSVLIYVNGILYGEKQSLNNIDASTVLEIQFYPSDESIMKFGSNTRGGVIDVRVR